MRKRSKGIIVFAVFFLILSFFWSGVIYERCSTILGKRTDRINVDTKVQDILAEKGEKKFPYVEVLWGLSLMEILCCLLYLLSGISLIRNYVFGRTLVLRTVVFDMLFKMGVVTFIVVSSDSLRIIINQRNILIRYYLEGSSFWAGVSSYLTGVKFLLSQGTVVIWVYVVYIFGCLFFFTYPTVKKQFER